MANRTVKSTKAQRDAKVAELKESGTITLMDDGDYDLMKAVISAAKPGNWIFFQTARCVKPTKREVSKKGIKVGLAGVCTPFVAA